MSQVRELKKQASAYTEDDSNEKLEEIDTVDCT